MGEVVKFIRRPLRLKIVIFLHIRRQFANYFLCLHDIIGDFLENFSHFGENFENLWRESTTKIKYLETANACFADWIDSNFTNLDLLEVTTPQEWVQFDI